MHRAVNTCDIDNVVGGMKRNVKGHLVQRNVVGRKQHVIINVGTSVVLGEQLIKIRHFVFVFLLPPRSSAVSLTFEVMSVAVRLLDSTLALSQFDLPTPAADTLIVFDFDLTLSHLPVITTTRGTKARSIRAELRGGLDTLTRLRHWHDAGARFLILTAKVDSVRCRSAPPCRCLCFWSHSRALEFPRFKVF
jgi:hypothetical protein